MGRECVGVVDDEGLRPGRRMHDAGLADEKRRMVITTTVVMITIMTG